MSMQMRSVVADLVTTHNAQTSDIISPTEKTEMAVTI
jgi:hypothetical protein